MSWEEACFLMAGCAVLAYLLGYDHGKQQGWRTHAQITAERDAQRAEAVRRMKVEAMRNQ